MDPLLKQQRSQDLSLIPTSFFFNSTFWWFLTDFQIVNRFTLLWKVTKIAQWHCKAALLVQKFIENEILKLWIWLKNGISNDILNIEFLGCGLLTSEVKNGKHYYVLRNHMLLIFEGLLHCISAKMMKVWWNDCVVVLKHINYRFCIFRLEVIRSSSVNLSDGKYPVGKKFWKVAFNSIEL